MFLAKAITVPISFLSLIPQLYFWLFNVSWGWFSLFPLSAAFTLWFSRWVKVFTWTSRGKSSYEMGKCGKVLGLAKVCRVVFWTGLPSLRFYPSEVRGDACGGAAGGSLSQTGMTLGSRLLLPPDMFCHTWSHCSSVYPPSSRRVLGIYRQNRWELWRWHTNMVVGLELVFLFCFFTLLSKGDTDSASSLVSFGRT